MNAFKMRRYQRMIQQNLTVTNIILAIQILLFLLMTVSGGSEDKYVLVSYGAKFNPYIQFNRQYWRFFTPIFLHIGWLHLLLNSVLLYYLGKQMEELIGAWRFLFIYIFSGMLGNIASFALTPAISAGASTSLFGLFGAIIYYAVRHDYVRQFKEAGMTYGMLIVANLLMGFLSGVTDNYGHIGGLFGGFLLATMVTYRGDRQTAWWERLAAVLTYILLTFLLFSLGMR